MKATYTIKGFYYRGTDETHTDTHFHHAGTDSIKDLQRIWYDESLKAGYDSGELDEAEIIRTNFWGKVTEEQLIAIINDGDLMDTPLDKLFDEALPEYLAKLLKEEYVELSHTVSEESDDSEVAEHLTRMGDILSEIHSLTKGDPVAYTKTREITE